MLGVTTPLELSNKFTELDQEEMRRGTYDYEDPNSLVNQLKNQIEALDPAALNEQENEWRNEMFWLWNHHAAGYALFGRNDRAASLKYAELALAHQSHEHPNKITKLIALLALDNVAGAVEYIKTIAKDSTEYDAAKKVLEMYKTHM